MKRPGGQRGGNAVISGREQAVTTDPAPSPSSAASTFAVSRATIYRALQQASVEDLTADLTQGSPSA